MMTKIKSSLEAKTMQTQFSVLGYTTDLFFHDRKLTIETDENDHSDRNINYEVKIQKRIEQKLGCKFIRINI